MRVPSSAGATTSKRSHFRSLFLLVLSAAVYWPTPAAAQFNDLPLSNCSWRSTESLLALCGRATLLKQPSLAASRSLFAADDTVENDPRWIVESSNAWWGVLAAVLSVPLLCFVFITGHYLFCVPRARFMRPPWRWFMVQPSLVVADEFDTAAWARQGVAVLLLGLLATLSDSFNVPMWAKACIVSFVFIGSAHSMLLSYSCHVLTHELMYGRIGLLGVGRTATPKVAVCSKDLRQALLFTPIHFTWHYAMINFHRRIFRKGEPSYKALWKDAEYPGNIGRFCGHVLAVTLVSVWLCALPAAVACLGCDSVEIGELHAKFLAVLICLSFVWILVLGGFVYMDHAANSNLLPQSLFSFKAQEFAKKQHEIKQKLAKNEHIDWSELDAGVAPGLPPLQALGVTDMEQRQRLYLRVTNFHDPYELFQHMWAYLAWHVRISPDLMAQGKSCYCLTCCGSPSCGYYPSVWLPWCGRQQPDRSGPLGHVEHQDPSDEAEGNATNREYGADIDLGYYAEPRTIAKGHIGHAAE
jgi:hypothetical protein